MKKKTLKAELIEVSPTLQIRKVDSFEASDGSLHLTKEEAEKREREIIKERALEQLFLYSVPNDQVDRQTLSIVAACIDINDLVDTVAFLQIKGIMPGMPIQERPKRMPAPPMLNESNDLNYQELMRSYNKADIMLTCFLFLFRCKVLNSDDCLAKVCSGARIRIDEGFLLETCRDYHNDYLPKLKAANEKAGN